MKNSLTQQDLETLEERLISNFNSRLEEYAKDLIDSLPKTGNDVRAVNLPPPLTTYLNTLGGSKMNAKRFVTHTLLPTLLFVCSPFATVEGEVRKPFSFHMTRAELVFVGTLVEKQYVLNPATNGFTTELTFDVNHLIEGEPNIDKDTVAFSIPGGQGIDPNTGEFIEHWSSMGQNLAKLELRDTVLLLLRNNTHIAHWIPHHRGLFPISTSHGCWFVKSEEVNNETEYTVYIWASSKDRLQKHPLAGMPIPLFEKVMNAARRYPEHIDPLIEIMKAAIAEATSDGIRPDTPEALSVHEPIIANFERVIDQLDAINAEAERK